MRTDFDVCLTTNLAYAAPTAVTARELATRRSEGVKNVFYVWADVTEPPSELLSYLTKHNIEIVKMPKPILAKLGDDSFHHIPSTTLARLFLGEILASKTVSRFLYVDGDVDVLASLEPLACVELANDDFAAVGIREEILPSKNSNRNSSWAKHVNGLGITLEDGYFNAGVFLANMDAYSVLAREAFDFFLANKAACVYLDQDALNAVVSTRRKRLSPRFNFQKSFFNMGVEDVVKPAIVHFNGFWKPWRPTPFTRTWKSRQPFMNSKSDLLNLWRKTWPLNQPMSSFLPYHSSSILSELRGRKKAKARAAEFKDNLLSNEFVDGVILL